MKKIYLTLVAAFCVQQASFGQWVTNGNNINNTNTGNVGINMTAPTTRLSVNSGATAPASIDLLNSITIGAGSANATNKYLGQFGFISNDSDFAAPKMVAYIAGEATETYNDGVKSGSAIKFYTAANGGASPTERMTIHQNGYIGIGISSPTSPVHTYGSSATPITLQRTSSNSNVNILYKDYNNSIYAGLNTAGGFSVSTEANLLAGALLTVQNGGNVGIGITTPAEKLAVNGNIRAKEVKVETANWPDYVFTKAYKLPSLAETESHIRAKGHLPGIPSAAEVKEKGIELGEMNKKLLEKIEELTLHLIEMKKENEDQKTSINGLINRIQSLENKQKNNLN